MTRSNLLEIDRIALGEARVQLQTGELGQVEADLLPVETVLQARRGKRGTVLVVVLAPLVRGEAHEVVEAVGRARAEGFRHVEPGDVPVELAVAAVVLLDGEVLEGLEGAVPGLDPGELERDRLLAPRQLLAAVPLPARVERGLVDVGVVLGVDGVERERRAGQGRGRVQDRRPPPAADDVEPAELQDRPRIDGRVGIGLDQSFHPDSDLAGERQVGGAELDPPVVGDRDAIAPPAIVAPDVHIVGEVPLHVGDQVRVLEVAEVDGVLEVALLGVELVVEIQVLGVGVGVDLFVPLGAVDPEPVAGIELILLLSLGIVLVEIVALWIGGAGRREIGLRQRALIGVQLAVEPGILGVAGHLELLVARLPVLAVQKAVRGDVRRPHLVLAHHPEVDVEPGVRGAHPQGVVEVVHP